MNRIFFISSFVISLFVLFGCSSNEVYTAEELMEQNSYSSVPMSGKIYVGGTSRENTITDRDVIKQNGFKVYIYKDSVGVKTEVFSGDVTLAPTVDDYSFSILREDGSTVNWEKGKAMHICAYYVPGDAGFEFGEDKIYATDGINGSGDVMVADTICTYDTTVPQLILKFKHITAKVTATVTAPDDKFSYVVDAIKFTVNTKADHGQEGSSTYTVGSATPSWTSTLYNIPLYLAGSETPGATENDDPVFVSYNKSVTYGTPLGINETLFLIPTAVTGSETNLTLAVSYTVKDKTSGVVRQSMTTLEQNFAVAVGSNTQFNIKLPILPAIGGSISVDDGWVTVTPVSADF